jgi:Protein of unknown function (DUF2786)
MVTTIYTDCEHCGVQFGQPYDPGRRRRFCSGACRTAAYRARKRRQEQADRARQERASYQERVRQQRERYERARRQREDQERHRRQRSRTHQPPPHAGTSRPRSFCGACGGLRAAHTHHHDDAVHERARRRYEGLKAKAASTTFPDEASACTAKAEQLRDKYGL